MKVLTVSRVFPSYHPKKGEPTHFLEFIVNAISPEVGGRSKVFMSIPVEVQNTMSEWYIGADDRRKLHTIRRGKRWKKGDIASIRVWSGKPYHSKQIEVFQLEIKQVWDIKIEGFHIWINKELYTNRPNGERPELVAGNDGLDVDDFWNWFPHKRGTFFEGQIISWSEEIDYYTNN